MDMEAHVMIVANDEWLTAKFTPDLETNEKADAEETPEKE